MIVIRTPLRVSLAGGGTDVPPFSILHGGAVVNAAIGLSVYVVLKSRPRPGVRVTYSRTEEVACADEVQHDLVREAMRLVGVDDGIEIGTFADVPGQGSGLGSSSATTVGLLHALHLYKDRTTQGIPLKPSCEQLAEEACEVEITRLGRHIGKQDQYAAAFGGVHLWEFGASVERRAIVPQGISWNETSAYLRLFWTTAPPPSATVLEAQAAANREEVLSCMAGAARNLAQRLEERPDPLDVAMSLRKGWQWKQQLTGEIGANGAGAAVEKALAAGAYAARICGAGGGGYMLVCADPEQFPRIESELGPSLPVQLGAPGSAYLLAKF